MCLIPRTKVGSRRSYSEVQPVVAAVTRLTELDAKWLSAELSHNEAHEVMSLAKTAFDPELRWVMEAVFLGDQTRVGWLQELLIIAEEMVSPS